MYKYKFLNILDSLSDKEFKSLGKFINSPYFNESGKIKELYEFLKLYYHNHSFDKITSEQISKKIFKVEKYNETNTRKLVSDFNLLLESFLIHNSLENDVIGKKSYLSNRLKAKELDKFYKVEIDELNNLINNLNLNSKSYFISKLKILDEELNMKESDINTGKKIENILDFIESTDNLYIFYRLYIYHILFQNNLQQEDKIIKRGFVNLEKIIENIEKFAGSFEMREPGIYLYYLTIKLILSESADKIYTEVEYYIEKNRISLNTRDIEFAVYTIINYLVNEISYGKYENIDIAVKVMKRIDEKGFFENINNMKYLTYIQIIFFALHIEDFEYTESFLWKYYPKIKLYKEDTINLALASLRFAQARYSEAKDHIGKINYSTYWFYLIANSLLLRIYFEENSLNFINPMVDSFKHYLKRNHDIPVYFKETFAIFLNYIVRLTSIKKKSRKDIFKFEYELSNERNFYGKKWIEEKINEIVISG